MAHGLYQKGLSIVGAKRHDAFYKMSARISARHFAFPLGGAATFAYPLGGAALFGTTEGLRNIYQQHRDRDKGLVPAYLPVDYDYASKAAGYGALKGLLIGEVARRAPHRIATMAGVGLLVGGVPSAYDALINTKHKIRRFDDAPEYYGSGL